MTTISDKPEPWDEALVGVVSDALAGPEGPAHHWNDDARRVLDALAARGYLDRAAITGGEQLQPVAAKATGGTPSAPPAPSTSTTSAGDARPADDRPPRRR